MGLRPIVLKMAASAVFLPMARVNEGLTIADVCERHLERIVPANIVGRGLIRGKSCSKNDRGMSRKPNFGEGCHYDLGADKTCRSFTLKTKQKKLIRFYFKRLQ